jgi:hypothetical protein
MGIFQFWAEEAEQEGQGRSGGELAAETNPKREQELIDAAERLKGDPKACWDIILPVAERELAAWKTNAAFHGETPEQTLFDADKGWVTEKGEPYDAGPRPHFPVQMLEVLSVKFGSGLSSRSSTTEIKARVLCDDQQERVCTYQCYQNIGSMFEPSEEEESLLWDDGTGYEVL